MGVLDKFLDIMKLSDEDDYDDDFFGEEEEFDDFDERPAKKSFFKRERASMEEDDFDDEPHQTSRSLSKGSSSNKVTPMRQPNTRRAPGMEVCVIKPSSVDDAREITETLLSGRTVILNLEGMDLEIAQRIIDFTSGATFAISGNLQKISNYIFLVTPTNVEISGDLQDLLGSSFDVPSIRTRF